jgi:wyosine [tRNA(Phe)-imidazoG37] synthetase (radical SAM superfamily)
MHTFLFDSIIFGPVASRRLGSSLGINLLPAGEKICTFNCIYCECGFTHKSALKDSSFPERATVKKQLELRLRELTDSAQAPDAITFAGNGEPTLHPEFEGIISDTIRIRDGISPGSKIIVLSNASQVHKPSVYNALEKVDKNVLKLDTGIEATFQALNQPGKGIGLTRIIENLKLFHGRMVIQTLFIRGKYNDFLIDNTSPEELRELFKLYWILRPVEVMVYTFARNTPVPGLEKIPFEELRNIANKIEGIGIKTDVQP